MSKVYVKHQLLNQHYTAQAGSLPNLAAKITVRREITKSSTFYILLTSMNETEHDIEIFYNKTS